MGVNTWDLMDKSRDSGSRPEIQSRLDAMVKAGWSVGRTWGFSLGSGLSDGPLGHVIADPTKILETAPGAHPSQRVFPVQDSWPYGLHGSWLRLLTWVSVLAATAHVFL